MKKTLATKPATAHPKDDYLQIVLVDLGEGRHRYVTWVRNLQSGGDHDGHYFKTLAEALADFNERNADRVKRQVAHIAAGGEWL
jgi:hypothetical protein